MLSTVSRIKGPGEGPPSEGPGSCVSGPRPIIQKTPYHKKTHQKNYSVFEESLVNYGQPSFVSDIALWCGLRNKFCTSQYIKSRQHNFFKRYFIILTLYVSINSFSKCLGKIC